MTTPIVTSTETLYLLLPETILVGAATLIYMLGAFIPKKFLPNLAAAGAILVAMLVLGVQDQRLHIFTLAPGSTISGPIANDIFGHSARWAILVFGLLFVMLSSYSKSVRPAAEYVGSLLLIIAGLMLVAVGYDLVILFLGLELVSIPTYVVLYLGRRDPHGQEATAKYFFLSILSSALLLYGFSFLYGLAGSTRLDHIMAVLQAHDPSGDGQTAMYARFGPLALLLIFAGLGFRMTAVPFHFYAPDVYQGTSNPNAGLLSTLPKIAGLLVLVRLVVASMPGLEPLGWRVALVMAVLTMTLGNILALWQDNIRRLLAYSSIAHGGYMLIGVAVGLAHAERYIGGVLVSDSAHGGIPVNGSGTALFYLAVYCLATIGAFAALKYLGSQERQIDGVDELAGLGRARPLAALALAVSMFSLAGVPPLAGFWGKLNLFVGALGVDSSPLTASAPLRPWFMGLAVIGVLNAAIAMAYYLRIVAVMYFRSAVTTAKAEGGPGAWWAMIACTLLVIGVGVYPGPWMGAADRAGSSVRQYPPLDAPLERDSPAPNADSQPAAPPAEGTSP